MRWSRTAPRVSCLRLSFLLVLMGLVSAGYASPAASAAPGYAEVSGGQLFYEVAGEGQPLVLIHGGNLDRRMWDEQFEVFAQQFRVIRYDVRGFGKSTRIEKPYSDIEDLYGLLQALQVDKAYVVGLSMGGRIAIDFALAHPDKVAALVLAGPGLSGFEWPPRAVQAFWSRVAAAREEGPEAAVELWLQDPYMAPAMEIPGVAEKVRRLSLDNSHVVLANPLLRRDLDPPAVGRLGEIRVPTLILIGDRDVDDILEVGGLLDVRVPGARKIVIRGAGHMINMEKPAEFNRAVLEFLGALEEE